MQDRLEQAARDVCCQGISLSVGARGGCVTVSAAVEMADMAEELVTIPPSLPSLRSPPVFASLARPWAELRLSWQGVGAGDGERGGRHEQ